MDLMSIRRGLMGQMAKSNIDIYEEVSKHCLGMSLNGTVEGTLPESMTIDFETLQQFRIPVDWNIKSGLKHLKIRNGTKQIVFGDTTNISNNNTKVNFSMLRNRGIETIEFTDPVLLSGDLSNFGQYMYDLEEIIGALDFTNVPSWTYSGWFNGSSKLRSIRFVPNSAVTVSTFDMSNLANIDTATIVSLANCLIDTQDTKTVRLHNNVKQQLPLIKGVVTQAGDYHLFTAVETGDTTLQSYISEIKGWTIA